MAIYFLLLGSFRLSFIIILYWNFDSQPGSLERLKTVIERHAGTSLFLLFSPTSGLSKTSAERDEQF